MRLTRLREEEEDAMVEWCRVLGDEWSRGWKGKGKPRVLEIRKYKGLGAEIKIAIKSRDVLT